VRLLRDLLAASARRSALVAGMIVLGAAGQASAFALAGAVLRGRPLGRDGARAGADRVVVLPHGTVVATGPWPALEPAWSHLAG
jgi:ATP-binding cassette, subfamily B, bacterial